MLIMLEKLFVIADVVAAAWRMSVGVKGAVVVVVVVVEEEEKFELLPKSKRIEFEEEESAMVEVAGFEFKKDEAAEFAEASKGPADNNREEEDFFIIYYLFIFFVFCHDFVFVTTRNSEN